MLGNSRACFWSIAVVTKACAVDERVAPALLTGMAFGLCFEACDVIWERFGLGILQTGGSIGHQNFLGLMSHFVVFPWFALLLAGERGWRAILGPASGVIVEVLTVSRATIGLAGMGYAGLFLLSSFRGWTSRKAILLAAGVVAVGVLTPLIISSFNKRFEREQRTMAPSMMSARLSKRRRDDNFGSSVGDRSQQLRRRCKYRWL